MATAEPAPAQTTMDKIYAPDPSRLRILVVGNSGVGKSSLISSAFGIDQNEFDIRHRSIGNAEITREYIANNDTRFVIHDSEGFEAGSKAKWEKVEAFIKDRCNERRRLEDRLHAICQPAHDTVKVDVIVVFTKYDLLYNEYHRKARKDLSDRNEMELQAETNAEKHLTRVLQAHPHVNFNYFEVSTWPKYLS
ncbi:hypothetical protein H0H87_002770 [Tephrocybe sp. NHM501043]|nr:hypothetical protein H0H87_002770 [Tephrocybe sp. NHM501043]